MDDNVVRVEFGPSPYVEIGELRDEIYASIMSHSATVPLAAVIGVLRIIEHELIEHHK